MVDWSDYYSLARFVELRHHDAKVDGSLPGLGSFNTIILKVMSKNTFHTIMFWTLARVWSRKYEAFS